MPSSVLRRSKTPWMMKETIFAAEHYVALMCSIVLWLLSMYTALLAYGAVQIPTFIGIDAFVLLIVGLYGMRALRKGNRMVIFFYGVIVWFLIVTLVILLGLLLININRGTEFIEENWYLIQTEVLPFSTELDTKRGISTNCMWVFYAGIFTVVLFIPAVFRAWQHVGGYLESSRAAMMFPLLLPQFAMAGFVCFFGIDGVELTQFATDKSSFALSLSATAAVGHFLVAIVCFVAVLRRPDDAGSYLSGGILAAPLALVSIGCGANVMVQAGTVRHFVQNNWHMVLQMLPSEFQQLSQDKYINASEDAFNFTGWLGLALGLFSLVYCAFSISVGYFMIRSDAYYDMPPSRASYLSTGNHRKSSRRSARFSQDFDVDSPQRKSSDLTTPATPAPSVEGVSLRANNDVVHPDDVNTDVRSQIDAAPATHKTALNPRAVSAEDNLRSRLVRGSDYPTGEGSPIVAIKAHYMVERNCCIITTVLTSLCFLGALIGIGLAANEHGMCGIVVRDSDAGHRTYALSFEYANGLDYVNVEHSMGKGTVTILYAEHAKDTLDVTLEMWGLTNADVAPATGDNPLKQAVSFSNVTNVLDVDIHTGLFASASRCLSATLMITLPKDIFDIIVSSNTNYAMNNLTSHAHSLFPIFDTVSMTSNTGSIGVNGVLALSTCRMVSKSGRIRVQSLAGANIHLESSNSDIIAINATSFSLVKQALSNVTLIGHGTANVIITNVFAGYNATVRSEDGDIIGVVAAVGVEGDLDMAVAGSGGIFLNNFIMASGSAAFLRTTSGTIKVAAMTANNLFINTDDGEVSLYEVFIGMPEPAGFTYPKPYMLVDTDSGGITVLGAGATPTSSAFASELVMLFRSSSSDIKVEVNGGGFAGRYNCATSGDIEVSVHGNWATSSGVVGVGGSGYVECLSDDGDVELSMLPGPLGT